MSDDDLLAELDGIGYPWEMKCGLMVRGKYRVTIYCTVRGSKEHIQEFGSSAREAMMIALDKFYRSRALFGHHMKPADHIKVRTAGRGDGATG